MIKQFLFKVCSICLLAATTQVYAEIYKTVDADGRVTYSNVKIKGAQKLNLEPADTSFGTDRTTPTKRANKSETPGNFPKVDANTQKQRDNSRKEVLKSELESEKAALAAAKQAYAEGESNPETYKTASGQTFRNVPKYEEKMKKLQEDIDVHQRNIDLLEKELGSVN